MVAYLITKVEANDFDARAVHVATVNLAHEVMLLIVGCVVLVLALVRWQVLGQAAGGTGVVVTLPLESQ